MMDTPHDVTGPINLGNPGEFTIRELAEKVIAATGSRLDARSSSRCRRTIPCSAGPTSRWRGSSSAGSPGITLDEGLAPTIDYFRTRLETL